MAAPCQCFTPSGTAIVTPDRRFDDIQHSYIIEFKYVTVNYTGKEVSDKLAEATSQLATYASDAKVQNMTTKTTLHKIVMVFKGLDVAKCEEV